MTFITLIAYALRLSELRIIIQSLAPATPVHSALWIDGLVDLSGLRV